MSAVRSTSRAADLYERHRGSVFGYCLSRLGRREDAEDAVQTTFVHAVRGLRRGVVPESEPAWLLGIARNVCLSRRERAARRRRLEEACDPAELERVAAAEDDRHEELIGLPDALRRLPAQQRTALLLRDWRGLSYDEVARELGVSRAAVETLIFRGRDALAELLLDEPRKGRRRRLALLGNVGSALAAAKDSLAGGAAVTKLAATGAAAVAVVGSGVAVDAVLADRAPTPPRPSPATTGAQPRVQLTRAASVPAPAPATKTRVRPKAAGERPAAPAPPVVAEAAPATPLAPAPTTAATAPSPPAPAATTDEPVASSPAPPPAPAKPKPTTSVAAAPQPLPAVETAVASTTTAVEETAAELAAPVEETAAAVTATVEETVATVEETAAGVSTAVEETVATVEETVATVEETAAQTTGLLPAEPPAPAVPALP